METNQIKTFLIAAREKKNNFGLVASILSLIAMFMPYITFSFWSYSESINYISTEDGKVFLVLLVVAAILYLVKRDGLACIVSIIMLYVAFTDVNNILRAETYGMGEQSIGSYLVILGSILMIAAPFVGDQVSQFISKNLNSNVNN